MSRLRTNRRRIPLAVAFALAVGLAAAPAPAGSEPVAADSETAAAATAKRLIIVYDGSQSMWSNVPSFGPERDERARRHRIVRDFTIDVLGAMAAAGLSYDVALYTFGQHDKADCRDHGMTVDFGRLTDPGHFDRLISGVRAVIPKGISPIAASLEDAARRLDGADDPDILLVTDGIEECETTAERQPCRLAAELKRQNARLRVFVIGVNLRSTLFEAIDCVARETGGRFWRIERPEELGGLSQDLRQTLATSPTPSFRLHVTSSIRPTRAFEKIRQTPRIELLDTEARVVTVSDTGSMEQRLSVGTYTVRVTTGPQVLTRTFTVAPPSGAVEFDWPLNPPLLRAEPRDAHGDPLETPIETIDWTLELVALANGTPAPPGNALTYRASTLAVQVPPGTYRLSATDGHETTWKTATGVFTATPGQTVDLRLIPR
jgi:hypothetical protein